MVRADRRGDLGVPVRGQAAQGRVGAELVIADAELDAHRANKRGQDVAESMALFNRIARGQGEERDDALRQVCELAVAGKLIPALKDAPRRGRYIAASTLSVPEG